MPREILIKSIWGWLLFLEIQPILRNFQAKSQNLDDLLILFLVPRTISELKEKMRSRIGTTGLDRAIAFCFKYLNGDRFLSLNEKKLIALRLKVFRRIEFKYLIMNPSDIESFF